MSHVLQREMEQELELVDNKGGGGVLGKVGILTIYMLIPLSKKEHDLKKGL